MDIGHWFHLAMIIASLGGSASYGALREYFVKRMNCNQAQSHVLASTLLAIIILVGINSLHDLLVGKDSYISLMNIFEYVTGGKSNPKPLPPLAQGTPNSKPSPTPAPRVPAQPYPDTGVGCEFFDGRGKRMVSSAAQCHNLGGLTVP
jgi:hypothetical protein